MCDKVEEAPGAAGHCVRRTVTQNAVETHEEQANSHDRPNKYDILVTTAFSLKVASVSDSLLSSDPVYVNVIVRISNNFKNYVLEVR
jgi:hypothetical protein